MKSILIFSYNPVPTEEYKTVEGSALRFWRMAQALKGVGYDKITIAVWNKFPQQISKTEGINITNFSDNPEELKKLIKGFDVVVFTCAMGGLSLAIYEAIGGKTKIVTDAYSPMYVEFLTKSPDKSEDDQLVSHYREYADAFSKILIGADHVLIGNDNQKHFYRGVMGGLGALPKHDDSRFITLPAFVEKDLKVTSRSKTNDKIKVLWFGGIYPWFDIANIIDAFADRKVSSKATLTIVGGSNPFYPKDNMRYNGKYINALEAAEQHGLIKNKTVQFLDWVEYNNRVGVFNDYDVAISANGETIENDYSFRLRVADLAGNGVPVITNGGDVLGDELASERAAFKVDMSTSYNIIKGLDEILSAPDRISLARKRLRGELYELLHIEGHINKLVTAIESAETNKQRETVVSKLECTDVNHLAPVSFEPSMLNYVSTKEMAGLFGSRIKKSLTARVKRLLGR